MHGRRTDSPLIGIAGQLLSPALVRASAHGVERRLRARPALEAQRALADEDLQAVDGRARPRSRAARSSARAARAVDQVDDASRTPDGSAAAARRRRRGRRGVQLTSISAATGSSTTCGRRAPRARSRVRFQHAHRRRPACAAPRRPRAPSRRRRARARVARRRRRAPPGSPGASVLSASIAPSSPKVSVFAAPIARAVVGRLVGERERRLLVRDRHVRAVEARRPGARGPSRRTARAGPGRRW